MLLFRKIRSGCCSNHFPIPCRRARSYGLGSPLIREAFDGLPEGAVKMILRDQVLYSTDEEVKRGDEYYQIVLDTEAELSPEMPFRVAIFHGLAGDGHREPESQGFFARMDEAESGFTLQVNKLLEKGFQHYSPAIHGVHDF